MGSSAGSLLLKSTLPTRKTVMSFLSKAGHIISDVAFRWFSSGAAEKRPKPISPSVVKRRFESWRKKYGITYSSEEEKCYRMKIYGENLARVTEQNRDNLARVTDEEFPKKYELGRCGPPISETEIAVKYELKDRIYKLFERQPNWSMKQLLQETDQTLKQLVQETDNPQQFLKKKKQCLKENILDDICVYNKSGANRGTYQLKSILKNPSKCRIEEEDSEEGDSEEVPEGEDSEEMFVLVYNLKEVPTEDELKLLEQDKSYGLILAAQNKCSVCRDPLQRLYRMRPIG